MIFSVNGSKNSVDAHMQHCIDLIVNFKITKCPKKDCKYFMLSSQLFDDMSDCEYFHFEEDKRRNPFVMADKRAQTNLPLLYENSQCENDSSSCMNLAEYMYHPLNIYTIECTVDECENKFCSFYHSEEERISAEKARGSFKPYSSKFMQLEESILSIGTNQDLLEDNWKKNYGKADSSDDSRNDDENNNDLKRMNLQENPVKRDKKKRNNQNNMASSKEGNEKKNGNTSKSQHKLDHSKSKDDMDKRNKRAKSKRDGSKDEDQKAAERKPIFFLNQEVKMFEDINTEFKNYTNLDFRIACNYICGYLNSSGGSLYFGISDSGIVKGINLGRSDIDEFQINLDQTLRKFTPKVFPDHYKLQFHEVANEKSLKKIIQNKYVVQIEVRIVQTTDVYVTGDNLSFIKRSGSLNNLTLLEVLELMKSRRRYYEEELRKSDDIINARNLNFLNRNELVEIKKNLQSNVIPKINKYLENK